MKDEFSIVRRRFNQDEEREEHSLIRTCGSPQYARKIMSSIDGVFGDIIFICDTAEVSEVSKKCKEIYVVNSRGKPIRAKKCWYEGNWSQFWEHFGEADDMIAAAEKAGISRALITASVFHATNRFFLRNKPELEPMVKAFDVAYSGERDGDSKYKQLNILTEILASASGYEKRLAFIAKKLLLATVNDDKSYITYIKEAILSAGSLMRFMGEMNSSYDCRVYLGSKIREVIPLRDILIAISEMRSR